jgi:hypothetical protein
VIAVYFGRIMRRKWRSADVASSSIARTELEILLTGVRAEERRYRRSFCTEIEQGSTLI